MAVKKVQKKAAPKKVAKKVVKKAVKKVAAKKAPVKKAGSAIKTPLTKTQITTQIAEATDLTKKQVGAVFDVLGDLVERSIKPRAAGSFTIPGLMKVVSIRKPAKKARKGVNPFTGEEMTFKAKAAHNVVKVRALKKLKDMVS
jgi:nucleoid DNA-binding protein